MMDAARDVDERLEKLLAVPRWGMWLRYAEVRNRALDWDTLFEVWRTKDVLLKRAMEHHEVDIHPSAKVHEVLSFIRFRQSDGTIRLYMGADRPSPCWTLQQTDGVISVVNGRTLSTVSDWCEFMPGVHGDIPFVSGAGQRGVVSFRDVCCWLMVAHYSGPSWGEVGRVLLRWESLVEFLKMDRRDVLAGGLKWFFDRTHDDRLTAAEGSEIEKHLGRYKFEPDSDSPTAGRFSYERHGGCIAWALSVAPGGKSILAQRGENSMPTSLRTVQDLRTFLSGVFTDVYFTPSGAKGLRLLSSDLTDYLMQQFRWW
jgi:hypothetical protein